MITKLPRLVTGVSRRFKGVKKLKPFNKSKAEPYKAPLKYDSKTKSIFINKKREISLSSSIARKDKASKVASHIEYRSLREGLRRIRDKSLSIFGTKGHYDKVPGTNFKRLSAKGKRAKAAFNKAGEKVRLISKRKSLRAYDKASTKLGVGKRRYGAKKSQTIFTSDYERKITGMPPVEYTADMKSFHGVRPSEMVRRHRKTISKVYSKFPKQFVEDKAGNIKLNKWGIAKISGGGKRGQVKSYWKGKIKSELKQAKIDRSIFRDTTVQMQSGTTRKGKEIWKTFRSPEKTYDVHTKRWKRTKLKLYD